MSASFNDRALARTLGTDDPEQIEALKSLLDDPDSPVALTAVDVDSDEPVYVLGTPEEEVGRIVEKYMRPPR